MQHLQSTRTTSVGVAFIYCNYNDPQKQTAINLIGCVLQQLMLQSHNLADELSVCFEDHRRTKRLPSISEYSSLLRSAAGYFSKLVIIIDALDECLPDTREIIMGEFGRVSSGFLVLATSRYIVNDLPGSCSSIPIQLQTDDMDIRAYLEERVTRSHTLKAHIARSQGLFDCVVSSIAGKAKGM